VECSGVGCSSRDKMKCYQADCYSEREIGPLCRKCYSYNFGVPAGIEIAIAKKALTKISNFYVDKRGNCGGAAVEIASEALRYMNGKA